MAIPMEVSTSAALSVNHVAELLACNPATLRKLVNEGKIRSVRLGKLVRIPRCPSLLYRGLLGTACLSRPVCEALPAMAPAGRSPRPGPCLPGVERSCSPSTSPTLLGRRLRPSSRWAGAVQGSLRRCAASSKADLDPLAIVSPEEGQ
jgi:excisionase family DNA binding protein